MKYESQVDILREERRSAHYIFHMFKLDYSEKYSKVYILVEGDADRLFYAPYLRSELQIRHSLFVCYGFPNMMSIYKMASSSDLIDSDRIYMVSDRDYSDFLDDDNREDICYVTDGYSLDSLLLDEQAVEHILRDDVGIFSDGECESFLLQYRHLRAEMEHKVRPLMAVCIAARQTSSTFELDELLPTDEVIVGGNMQLSQKKLGAIYRKALLVLNEKSSRKRIQELYRQLAAIDPRKWIRGKIAFRFVKSFVSAVRSRAQSPAKASFEFGERGVFSFLGGRLQIPAHISQLVADVHSRWGN